MVMKEKDPREKSMIKMDEKFWNDWVKAGELKRITLVEKLPICRLLKGNGTLLNSYFVDLYDFTAEAKDKEQAQSLQEFVDEVEKMTIDKLFKFGFKLWKEELKNDKSIGEMTTEDKAMYREEWETVDIDVIKEFILKLAREKFGDDLHG